MKNFWLKVPTGEIIHNCKCKLKNKFFLQFKFNLRLILFVPWKGCSPCCGGGARRESLTSPPSPSQSADWDPVALENSPGKSVIYQGKSAKSSNWWGGGGRFKKIPGKICDIRENLRKPQTCGRGISSKICEILKLAGGGGGDNSQ